MFIRLRSLILNCQKGKETLELSPQVSFFHGKMSAGKSSIARLIDYCLGASDVERTTAITKELIGVELHADIETNSVVFQRTVDQMTNVQVTWIDSDKNEFSVLAPLKDREGLKPLIESDVFTFSDLMYFLFGKKPLKVPRNSVEDDAPMVRLSIRDILWYCYLEQNRLDNSFFKLEDAFRKLKSRNAIRYVLGYYSERLEELQSDLTLAANDRAAKLAAAGQLRSFLDELGYQSDKEIQTDRIEAINQLDGSKKHLASIQTSFHANTHFVDDLRRELRKLSNGLAADEVAVADQKQRLDELQALKSELKTAQQKLSRTNAAIDVFAGVKFGSCPQCGTKLQPQIPTATNCGLCGNVPTSSKNVDEQKEELSAATRDVESRIEELEDSIKRLLQSLRLQEKKLHAQKSRKQDLDRKLDDELRNYDSAFLSERTEAERRIATLEERIRGLERLQKLPDTIQRLEGEAGQLLAEQERIRREIQEEQTRLENAKSLVSELETTYLKILLAVGVPGVGPNDRVRLNRANWVPDILEGGDDKKPWNFYTAGSNGKKTLLNVCYALAVHELAEANERPLPTLLMIDHPMKCTSPDVNKDVFEAFYRYLYGAVRTTLKRTQVILIDNDYFAPDGDGIQIFQRYMTPDDDNHPPLISYYRGP